MKTIIVGKCLLSELLKQRRMTSTDLSDLTGISIYQLSKYINNKSTMSLPTALLIAWCLKVDVNQLYQYKVK